jgi:exoribonuclease R
MEIDVDLETGELYRDTATFNNKLIVISKNYAYESPELLSSEEYQLLFRATKIADPAVGDSQDVVAFWMIQMNAICGELLKEKGVGIFREASFHPNTKMSGNTGQMEPNADLPADMPKTTRQLITNWKHTTGQYVAYYEGMEAGHAIMCRSFYVHITSPIRRLVDLLNQILFISTYKTADVSIAALDFVKNWSERLDYINTAMRSIRKVQVDCNMLHKCTVHPEWMEREHRGVVFDRIKRTDGMYSYMVHLVDLNVLSRFSSPSYMEEHRVEMFRLFVFGDEDRLQRKIRVIPSGNRL